ncbi:MAG: hypothetical protein JWN38_1244 [Candidatus Saccharibacteria bacterium]|nr:hypothetical protein [Candidatus Saccharibacteria bacterium]
MNFTDKIMEKLNARSSNDYMSDDKEQHTSMMGRMKGSLQRLRGNRH